MKKLLVSFICLTILFSLTGCGNNTQKKDNDSGTNKTDQPETSTNGAITLESQVVGGLTFEHFAITKDSNDISILYFDISNKTDNSIDVGNVTFTLYDDGYEILSLKENINETIEPGQSKPVIGNFDIDMSNVDEVKYTVE